MAQFPWHKSPLNANDMSSTEILIDLHDQASAAEHRFSLKIFQSMTGPDGVNGDAWKQSDDQLEPAYLGDLIKLIGRKIGPSLQLIQPTLQVSLHTTSPISANKS